MEGSNIHEIIASALGAALYGSVILSSVAITLYSGTWLVRHRHG